MEDNLPDDDDNMMLHDHPYDHPYLFVSVSHLFSLSLISDLTQLAPDE